MTTPKRPLLVEVEWCDAWSENDMPENGEFKAECVAKTVGWLLRREPTITVAQEFVQDTYRGITHIPPVLVRKIVRLRRDSK